MIQEIINNLVATLIGDNQPNLNDIKEWYIKEILPKRNQNDLDRTNKMGKGFKAYLFGNSSDPHGVCGDVTSFVFTSFENKFPTFLSSRAGFNIGAILRVGVPSENHIANVIYPLNMDNYIPISIYVSNKRLVQPNTKPFNENILTTTGLENDILVLDLFYLEQPQSLLSWLTKRNYTISELKIGREYDFD